VSDAEIAALNIKRAEFTWRVELHHLTEYLSAKLRVYFLTSPKGSNSLCSSGESVANLHVRRQT
jgi:hypothetical protein